MHTTLIPLFLTLALLSNCALPSASQTPTPTASTFVSDGKVPAGAQLEAALAAVDPYLKDGSPGTDGRLYPLYRQLKAGENHFYTASKKEAEEKKQAGYTTEGIIGHLLAKPEDCTRPVYHLFGRNDHFYTTSHQEAFVNISGFLYADKVQGTVPLYRHFNGFSHFYTTSAKESQSIPSSGWNLEGIAGYVPEHQ